MTENKSLAVIEGTNLLEVFTNTAKLVTASELPSREVVQQFCRAALNAVATDVRLNNIAGAIETMQQTKAIEDYVKAKIKQQHGNIILSNEVAITRARQLREIGWWLNENVVEPRRQQRRIGNQFTGIRRRDLTDAIRNGEKPNFFLDELNITEGQSKIWQNMMRIPEDEFEAYVAEFLKDGDTRIEKYFFPSHLITWWYKKDKDADKEIVIPEEIKTKEGQELYLWMREGKERVTAYIELLRNFGVGVSEIMVIVGLDFWGNIFKTYQSLKKLATPEINDENPTR